jgi:hypothetical protein
VIAPQLYSPETCELRDSDRDIVINLVHDLRQPLSSIEAIACYLHMRLAPEQGDLREYVLKLQDLVDEANTTLSLALAGKIQVAAAGA